MRISVTTSNTSDPNAIRGNPQAVAIPVVAAAGISAAAIMTPITEVGPFVERPNAAAAPAASPTMRLNTPGAIRTMTSSNDKMSSGSGTNPPYLRAKLNAVAPTTATTRPVACRTMLLNSIGRSPVVAPTAAVSTGPTIGAITIDPTTTAGEPASRPAVAMIALRKINATNDCMSRLMSPAFDRSSGVVSGSKSLANRCLSSSVCGVIAVSTLAITVYWSSWTPTSSRMSSTYPTASVGTGISRSHSCSPLRQARWRT